MTTATGRCDRSRNEVGTTPGMVRQMWPRIDEWREVRAAVAPQGIFNSDMSRRLAL